MSEEKNEAAPSEPADGSPSESAASEAGPRGRKPGDLPIPLVVVAITLAVLAFGWIGWKRYQSMREEMLRELAAEEGRIWSEVQQDLRQKAEEERRLERAAQPAEGAAGGPGEGEAPGAATDAEP